MRGWSKDAQRAVFQPVMLAAMAMTAISLTAAGAITPALVKLYLLGLPALLAGLGLGFRLYGKLDEATFRKLILFLLLAAGVALVAVQGPSLIRTSLGAPLIAPAGAAPAAGEPVCKPVLRLKDARLSPMQAPTLKREWTATVTVDAARCASTAGYFEVGFSRMKENSMEVEFREQFIWATPSVVIRVDFSADEAVEAYWIDSVQACPCATGPVPRDVR
jgi:hypothetical protein